MSVDSRNNGGAPAGKRVKAFRAIETILREDDTLKRLINHWSSWNGDRIDTMVPTLDILPMIQLRPRIERNREFTQAHRAAGMGVSIRVMVPGLDADYLINLWDAVEDALVGSKPFRNGNVGCFLQQECGAVHFEVREPGFGAWQTRGAEPTRYLAGEGLVVVSFLRPR